MNDQLEQIKKLHEQANELYSSSNYTDNMKAQDLIMRLFGNGDTDWLIEQVEKLEKLESAYFDDNYHHSGFMRICDKVFGT